MVNQSSAPRRAPSSCVFFFIWLKAFSFFSRGGHNGDRRLEWRPTLPPTHFNRLAAAHTSAADRKHSLAQSALAHHAHTCTHTPSRTGAGTHTLALRGRCVCLRETELRRRRRRRLFSDAQTKPRATKTKCGPENQSGADSRLHSRSERAGRSPVFVRLPCFFRRRETRARWASGHENGTGAAEPLKPRRRSEQLFEPPLNWAALHPHEPCFSPGFSFCLCRVAGSCVPRPPRVVTCAVIVGVRQTGAGRPPSTAAASVFQITNQRAAASCVSDHVPLATPPTFPLLRDARDVWIISGTRLVQCLAFRVTARSLGLPPWTACCRSILNAAAKTLRTCGS